jgi:hypothetical protein
MLLNLGDHRRRGAVWVLFIGPMFNYARARRYRGNREDGRHVLHDHRVCELLSFLETFFLARNDSLWLMHIFAVFGLHLLARFRLGEDPLPR